MEELPQLISLISKSKDEFIFQYKECSETSARKICLQLLGGFEKAIKEGTIDSFKKIKNCIEYIRDVESETTFADYYNSASNPMKNTNLVILACKYNKIHILKDIFSSDKINLSNLSPMLPDNEDEAHHNAFYYAIRTDNVELLDTLISKWPGNYFAVHLEELDEILSRAYEELLLINVPLSDEIRIFVESQLLDCRFFSNNSEQIQNAKSSLSNINERIRLVLDDITLLKTDYSNTKEIDERFLFIARFVAQNLHILKKQLKCTYNRLPWEEIEFCLICFISSRTKHEEINLFYHITLDKVKILNNLENFAKELKDEQNNIKVMDIKKLAVLPKLKREKIVAQIISNCPDFKTLYTDYQQVRDIYSLKKINNYIGLASSVNPKTKETKLIITRVLQMIGEYVKDTLESPKLSIATNELLLLSLPKDTRKIITDLRNSLSHAYSLSERTKIEQNKDINFFIGVQNDIKKIGSVITDILFNNKIKTIRTLLETIANTENIDEIKEVGKLLDNAELPENISESETVLEHQFEKLIEELNNSIPAKTNYEVQLFNKINNIINVDKIKLGVVRSNYMQGFATLKAVNILCERISYTSLRGLKSLVDRLLKDITPEIEPHKAREVAELSILIFKSVQLRVDYESLEEINRIVSKIFYIAEFGGSNFKWIEELRGQLNEKDSPISTDIQRISYPTTREKYDNQLILKISELKCILDNSVLRDEIIENFCLYKRNKILRTVVETLLVDIMSILGISKKRLGNNDFFLDGSYPLLTGKCLRNHMAHDNALVGVLLSDPSISVILNAIKLTVEDLITNKNQIGKCLIEDIPKLKIRHERGLASISNQEMMFVALEKGNLDDLIRCLERGADLKARNNNLWSSLHFAAKGNSLKVIKFILDQNLTIDVKDIENQNPLHIAAAYGRTSFVEFFVEDLGIHIDDVTTYGKTPLHIAAQRGHKEIVKMLLKYEASTITKDIRAYSPLHYAVENNHKDIVEILLKKEINIDFNRTESGHTLLSIAAKNGHLELVIFLLQNEANPNAKDNNNGFPIHSAAINGYVDILKALIFKGADVNVRFTLDGCTPLHYAVEYGHQEIVNILLEHGANVDAVNKVYNNTPLHYAANFGRLDILNTLLKNKANVNVVSSDGITPLHTAVQNGHLGIVTVLLKGGAKIHAIDKRNSTPLHYAAQNGHKEIAGLLIKSGAGINVKGYHNFAPLHEAAIEGHADVTTLLIKNKAGVNVKDFLNNTPLHAAAMKGRQQIIDILIKNRAKVNARNKGGLTALHFAALEGHRDIVVLLIKNGAETNTVGDNGATPLCAAILEGRTDVVKILIKNKANVNAAGLGCTPLHLAAETGNKEIIGILVANRANVNATTRNNMTPLASAVKSNRKEIVEYLIANGADINAGVPLLYAVLDGFKDIVEILLQNKVNINVTDDEKYTPLHIATIRGHAEIADILIRKGSDVNAATVTGSTLLHVAAKKGHIEVMEILIANGAKINVQTSESTPLHLTIEEHGRREIVKILLNNGSDVNIKNNKGLTALDLAVVHNRLECVKEILENKKLDVNGEFSDNWNALHIAVEKGNLEMIKCLIDGWSNINGKNASGQTLLHYAVKQGQIDVVKYLILKGVDVNVQDDAHLTPMHTAAVSGSKDVIEVLLKNGAVYNTVDKSNRTPLDRAKNEDIVNLLSSTEELFDAVEYGCNSEVENCIKKGAFINTISINDITPLHNAVRKGSKAIVDILLENNANPNATIEGGYTPLHYAAKFSHYEIVKALLSSGAIYNFMSDKQETPLDLAVHQDIVSLLNLTNECFKNAENRDLKVINDLNTICDIDTVKAITNAHNKENQTLAIVAIHNGFPKINQLKEILQDDISTQINIAKVLFLQEKYEEALKIFMTILEKRSARLGPNNPSTLDVQGEIARIFFKQENYQQALNVFIEIYKKKKESLGINNNDTLNTRNAIALVLHKQGQYQEAFSIYEEIYQKQKELLGIYHPDVLRTQTYMGLVLEKQNRHEEALDINYEVFAKEKKVLGKTHPVTLSTQNNIAMVFTKQGKLADALKVHQQIYETKKRVLVLGHPDINKTLLKIIEVLYRQKKYDEALQVYNELLDAQKTVLDPCHPDILNTQYNIASLLFDQGKFVSALKYYQESFLEDNKNILAQTHPGMVDKFESYLNLDVVQEIMNFAASKGDEEIIRCLLQNEFNVNDRDTYGKSAIHYAAGSGPSNLGVVNMLLTSGADATQVTAYGNTPLHTAAFRGCTEIIEILLKCVRRDKFESFINAKIPFCGITSLHIAANNGSLDIVKCLLKYGAAYDIENEEGKTPQYLSKEQSVYDLLKLVDELFEGIKNGNVEIIAKLKSIKSDEFLAITKARNKQGATLLQVAIFNKNMNIASKLIEILKEVS